MRGRVDAQERELRRRATQQASVTNLSHFALACPSLDALLRRASTVVTNDLGADLALVVQRTDDEHTVRIAAHAGDVGLAQPSSDLAGATQVAYTLQTAAPVVVVDRERETRFPPSAFQAKHGIVSAATVPILARSHSAWGVLGAYSQTRRVFTVDEVDFLCAIAAVIAQAVAQGAGRQSALAELTRLMFASDDPAPLDRACEQVRELLAVDDSLFLELDTNTRELRLRAGQPWAPEVLEQLSQEYVDGPVIVTDYAIVVPVTAGNGCTFILTAHARRPRSYSADDVSFLQTLAYLMAARVERDRTRSELRDAEAKLEQANRIAGLGRLAATTAHEFNNVLMGIAPFVEVMRRGKSIESSLDHISRAVQRGRRITQDILRFTQPAEPSRTPIDLELWLQTISLDAKALLAPASTVDVRATADRLCVDGDPAQLQQVFTNLIVNARDAMPAGGRVTIELGREEEGAPLQFALAHPERYAHFIVRDTGSGMTAEMLRHVFEPLFTTKRNGTGLGLPVALQVVQRHGGEMFVESTPGAGTAFHIFLPLSEPAAPARTPEPEPAPAPVRPAAKRILLVEDDTTVALGLVLLLELEGMEIRVARTGAEALSILERGLPDVMILDLGLPDIDGPQLFETVASRFPNLPVIFSTGHGDRTKIEALLTRPNVGFLLKPYNHATLLETIAEVTKKARAA